MGKSEKCGGKYPGNRNWIAEQESDDFGLGISFQDSIG
jgi:hypothetical protein